VNQVSWTSLSSRSPIGDDELLGCMGEPEEVAGLAAHLASAGADFIIGASLTIDGGYVA